jgi:hypothetical protein
MRRFMFVGGLPSHIYNLVSFLRFGQVESLAVETAEDAATGGSVILPADDPAALAFTADELKQYASFGAHDRAPEGFKAKVFAARVAAHHFAEGARANIEARLQNQATPVPAPQASDAAVEEVNNG